MTNGTNTNEQTNESERMSVGVSVVHASACENCEVTIEKVIVSAKVNTSDHGSGPLCTQACKCNGW